jgi:hypothetical protein
MQPRLHIRISYILIITNDLLLGYEQVSEGKIEL